MIPISTQWVGHIVTNFPVGTARLVLARPHADGSFEVINTDGTVTTYEAGVKLPEGLGWEIPAEALAAIAQAIERFQGDTGHAATEVRVLRETLKKEQDRVDRLLERALNG